jgi:hypothetical protein
MTRQRINLGEVTIDFMQPEEKKENRIKLRWCHQDIYIVRISKRSL